MSKKLLMIALALALSFGSADAAPKKSSSASDGTDNRIKTLVYNDNEVYQVVARSGFQSQIEFGPNENIETISIGDAIGWQITPAGRRIFLKPLHKTGITNLAVITNKHTYQFELISTDSGSRSSNHAYLMRFYYPDLGIALSDPIDRTRNSLRPVSNTPIPLLPPTPRYSPAPMASAAPVNQSFDIYNFSYTLTGPEDVAPKKIYDDGKITYFEFAKEIGPMEVAIINPDGSEQRLQTIVKDGPYNKTVSVDRIAGKFNIHTDGRVVQIFNEQILSLAPLNPNLGRN